MGLNLASTLASSVHAFPDETALIHDNQRLSYVELGCEVTKLARHLRRLGVRRGERVIVYSPNRMGFTVAYFATLHIGAVVVPVSHLAVARELRTIANDSTATAIIASRELESPARETSESSPSVRDLLVFDESQSPFTVADGLLEEHGKEPSLEDTHADDTAVILYTSGTTGKPKGAELTHLNLAANARFYAEKISAEPGAGPLGPGDVLLAALPLSHAFGQSAVQNAAREE